VLGIVNRNASRGCGRLYVSSTALFMLNGWVRLTMDNPSNSLANDLHSGLITAEAQHANKANMVAVLMRITEVGWGVGGRGSDEWLKVGPVEINISYSCSCFRILICKKKKRKVMAIGRTR
jgi:hypothetical protein